MQLIEISAKTLAEATQSASEKLGVSVDKLNVTVLEETKGLFGKSVVRIRAEVIASEPTPEPKTEPVVAAKPKGGKKSEEPVAEDKPAKKRTGKREPEAPAAVEAEVTAAPAEVTPEKAEGPQRKGRGRQRDTAPAAESTEESTESTIVATQQDADQLAVLVKELIDSAGLNVSVRPTTINGRYVSIQLDGKDVAFLVGKHGEVLNALQYLVNIIASRKFDNGVRATLDGNDYRRRREEALTQLATNIAEQVKARGEEAVLDALPAFERRIVHKALGDYEGISTYSEGEEPNRRVVIAPAD